MPLFMDVHNIEGGVSASDVAGAHEADLATQCAHAVKYLRYWVDEEACWEGMSAQGLAMVAEATGESGRAFTVLADARTRCNRLADPYVWLDCHILDAQCQLGLRHNHTDTELWIGTMQELASRTGMKELTVRSLLHRAALGHEGDAPAAALIATDIDNPALDVLFDT